MPHGIQVWHQLPATHSGSRHGSCAFSFCGSGRVQRVQEWRCSRFRVWGQGGEARRVRPSLKVRVWGIELRAVLTQTFFLDPEASSCPRLRWFRVRLNSAAMARWRLGKGHARLLHDLQLHGHRRSSTGFCAVKLAGTQIQELNAAYGFFRRHNAERGLQSIKLATANRLGVAVRGGVGVVPGPTCSALAWPFAFCLVRNPQREALGVY